MKKDMKKDARKSMLKALSSEMGDAIGNGRKDNLPKPKLGKITVSSDSVEGIKKGASMAEEIMEKMHSRNDIESKEDKKKKKV